MANKIWPEGIKNGVMDFIEPQNWPMWEIFFILSRSLPQALAGSPAFADELVAAADPTVTKMADQFPLSETKTPSQARASSRGSTREKADKYNIPVARSIFNEIRGRIDMAREAWRIPCETSKRAEFQHFP